MHFDGAKLVLAVGFHGGRGEGDGTLDSVFGNMSGGRSSILQAC